MRLRLIETMVGVSAAATATTFSKDWNPMTNHVSMRNRVLNFTHRFDPAATLEPTVYGYENQHTAMFHHGDTSVTVIGFDHGDHLTVKFKPADRSMPRITGVTDDGLLENLARMILGSVK